MAYTCFSAYRGGGHTQDSWKGGLHSNNIIALPCVNILDHAHFNVRECCG